MRFGTLDIRLVQDRQHKTACRDFMYEQMVGDEHGLTDLAWARTYFDDVARHDYIAAYQTADGSLVATYRLWCDYDISRHRHFNRVLTDYCESGGRLADVGSYTSMPFGMGLEAFQGLFVVCVRFLLERGIGGIYIQAQTRRVQFFKRVGFSVVGDTFTLPEWRYEWYPMLMQVQPVMDGFDGADFQSEWQARVGEPLNVAFWSKVIGGIRTPVLPAQ